MKEADGAKISPIERVLGRFWDFIDKRNIDKHTLSISVMLGTYTIVHWAMGYAAANADKPGLDTAAVIAAVNAPYMALQAAAISFYFKARR